MVSPDLRFTNFLTGFTIEICRNCKRKVEKAMKKLIYRLGRLSEEQQLELDFEDGLSRTVEERVELGFIPMKIPVIDETPYRIFDAMDDYRRWASKNLPKWLGYTQ